MGTGNRIIPLGEQYLELFAVVDTSEAERTGAGQWFLSRLANEDSFLAWALQAGDLDADACRVAAANHSVEATGISWIEIQGDERRVRERIGAADAPVRITPGRSAIIAIGIARGAGEIVFRDPTEEDLDATRRHDRSAPRGDAGDVP